MPDLKSINPTYPKSNGFITVYMLDLEDETDLRFFKEQNELQINIISRNYKNNSKLEVENMVNKTVLSEHLLYEPIVHTKEHVIGATTFIVSSRFTDDKPCDIVSKIARLIKHDIDILSVNYS